MLRMLVALSAPCPALPLRGFLTLSTIVKKLNIIEWPNSRNVRGTLSSHTTDAQGFAEHDGQAHAGDRYHLRLHRARSVGVLLISRITKVAINPSSGRTYE